MLNISGGAVSSELRSYDVFDTVITRMVGEPASAFLLIGQSGLANDLWLGSAEQFVVARIAAESRARKNAAPREVSFSAIYSELARSNNLSSAAAGWLAEIELTIERRLIRAVPLIASELERIRRVGHRVVFISDMYLPHDVLHTWLVELGLLRVGEALWVSSEHGVTKGGGELYDTIRAADPQAAREWIHKGDNEHADIRPATLRGIGTQHYVDCHLTSDERLMEGARTETGGLSSLFAGASRWTRLSRPANTDAALNAMAAGIASPVIYAFVLWVLLEAKKRGLRRIWFMARDGQVMLPVARAIADRLDLAIELGYLYGGRQVVRVASLVTIDDAAIDWMIGGSGVMTLQAVLDRVGLSLTQVRHVADELKLPTDGQIGWAAVPALRRFLVHPEVAEIILGEAAKRRAVVLDYFRSCGLIGGEGCAVVDIRWRGNVLRSIVDLIGEEQASKHTFMYFGLYSHPRGCESIPKIAYLFDMHGSRRVGSGHDIPSITTLMEIFCQADHGQVMKLERQAGGFVPVCREVDSSSSRWDIQKFQAATLEFANAVLLEEVSVAAVDLRGLCDRLLRRLAMSPTIEEVSLLAPIGFVDDQGGSEPQPFAYGYRWRDLRVAYRTGTSCPSLGLNWWAAGAGMLTPKPIMWMMRLVAKFSRWRSHHHAPFAESET